MKLLFVYGSTEGQTKKIADKCSLHLEGGNHDVSLKDCRHGMPNLNILSFDGAIIAGSVHQKRHQKSLENFTLAHRKELMKIPTLLLSISLSIAFRNGASEAQKYVEDFYEITGFKTEKFCLVAGALKFDQYDHYMDQIIRHVVLENQQDIREDKEFTDWPALYKTLDAFCDTI